MEPFNYIRYDLEKRITGITFLVLVFNFPSFFKFNLTLPMFQTIFIFDIYRICRYDLKKLITRPQNNKSVLFCWITQVYVIKLYENLERTKRALNINKVGKSHWKFLNKIFNFQNELYGFESHVQGEISIKRAEKKIQMRFMYIIHDFHLDSFFVCFGETMASKCKFKGIDMILKI